MQRQKIIVAIAINTTIPEIIPIIAPIEILFEEALDRLVPEGNNLYLHTDEGLDDAPCHIKCSLIGPSITIPITNGKLCIGNWQGIVLCEFRTEVKCRVIVATISGLKE